MVKFGVGWRLVGLFNFYRRNFETLGCFYEIFGLFFLKIWRSCQVWLVNLAGSRINGVVGFKTSGYTVFLVFILCKKGKNMATIGKLCLRSTIHRNQLVLTSRLLATSASRMKKEGKILPNPFKSNFFYEEINSKIHTNINFVIIVYFLLY